jgi:alcohol dehydrogenase (NADP+)
MTPKDGKIEILYSGICHSDLHYARNEWSDSMATVYPCVPGHEIIGRVTDVGSEVTRFKAGEVVGVGCLVDSDRTCANCREGLEQYCPNFTLTYAASRVAVRPIRGFPSIIPGALVGGAGILPSCGNGCGCDR